jgi:FtsP/CotA-like multicopper oxidase with cupredoxin domain
VSRLWQVAAAWLVCAPLGCRTGHAPVENAWVDLTPATDENPDPTIVEVSIEAREAEKTYLPGVVTKVLSYNGTVPGPLIEARQGDQLVVHFKNSLTMGTTIHWHGVRVPNAMDGSLAVQMPVGQGGRFDYEFGDPYRSYQAMVGRWIQLQPAARDAG